jgi:multidrug efflux pump subunit AcrA (membrane-fusion protein)
MPDSTRAGRRTRHVRRLAVGGTVTVVVLAAGTTAWAMSSSSGATYRTATVGRGSVQQVLTTTGTISPLHSADVDFQVAGTVQRILARQGATVRAGQRLATLDRASLKAALAAAQSTLSAAKSQLASDESGESTVTTADAADAAEATTATTTTATTVVDVSMASPAPSPHPTPTGGGSQSATIARDQAVVVAAQHTTDADLATARTALKAETSACAADLGSGSCTSAATTLLTDQTTVSSDEKAVLGAENTLNADVEKLLVTAPRASSSPTPRTSATTNPRSGSTGSGRTTSGSAQTRTVTAASLAADEATIDNDRASVATSRADLAEATITSPISGHVSAVTISNGDTVAGSSSSTSPAFEVRGAGRDQVTLSLTAAQVRAVRTGMAATATPDGSSTSLPARVISIGAASSDSTYPVAIELDRTSSTLVSGADAAVTLTLSTVNDATTVPTSAVHRSGTQTYVELLKAGKEVRRTVVVGAVGAAVTQVKSGLSPGRRVVLAALDAPVPSSSNTLTRRVGGGGLSGRFSGAGGGFGGPPAGGFGGFGGAGG